jgi:hypothetical protein
MKQPYFWPGPFIESLLKSALEHSASGHGERADLCVHTTRGPRRRPSRATPRHDPMSQPPETCAGLERMK